MELAPGKPIRLVTGQRATVGQLGAESATVQDEPDPGQSYTSPSDASTYTPAGAVQALCDGVALTAARPTFAVA